MSMISSQVKLSAFARAVERATSHSPSDLSAAIQPAGSPSTFESCADEAGEAGKVRFAESLPDFQHGFVLVIGPLYPKPLAISLFDN
jgi:hypothetical protein